MSHLTGAAPAQLSTKRGPRRRPVSLTTRPTKMRPADELIVADLREALERICRRPSFTLIARLAIHDLHQKIAQGVPPEELLAGIERARKV
jgi:hypothetical protein